ncbi:MAG: DUF1467 family protein [Robiginitomaculum sp.]|nr:DUF1467 family protein [Robiginitomaculum sp.]
MPIVTALAIYFVIWWLSLFVVLPWGIRGQHEDGNVVKGTEPGAPIAAMMKKKVIQNSILAGVIWLVIMIILKFDLISVLNLPFYGDLVPKEI